MEELEPYFYVEDRTALQFNEDKYTSGRVCFLSQEEFVRTETGAYDRDEGDVRHVHHKLTGQTLYFNASYIKMLDSITYSTEDSNLEVLGCRYCGENFWPESFVLKFNGIDLQVIHLTCTVDFKDPENQELLTQLTPCKDCQEPFLLEEFLVMKPDYKMIHLECKSAKCTYCQKIIGTADSLFVGSYICHLDCANIFSSSYSNSDKMESYTGNDKQSSKNKGLTCYGKVKYKARSVIDVDAFWPDICTKASFIKYPREFRQMAMAFMLIIRRLKIFMAINNDILFKILNMAVQPACFPVQNGFDLTRVTAYHRKLKLIRNVCSLCLGPTNVTRFDRGCGAKCKYFQFRCERCTTGVVHGADPRVTCTEYRCINWKCSACGGKIRHAKNAYSGGCEFDDCDLFYRVDCWSCKGRVLKMDSNNPNFSNYCTSAKCKHETENKGPTSFFGSLRNGY